MTAAILLALMVAASWLAAAALFRLPTPADRIHGIAFVNVATGACLLLAAILTEGATPRVAKVAAIVAINLLAGAAAAHLLGRALYERGDR